MKTFESIQITEIWYYYDGFISGRAINPAAPDENDKIVSFSGEDENLFSEEPRVYSVYDLPEEVAKTFYESDGNTLIAEGVAARIAALTLLGTVSEDQLRY